MADFIPSPPPAMAEEPSSFRARVLRKLRQGLAPIYQAAEASRLAAEIEASALRMGVTNKGDYLRNIAVRLTAVVKSFHQEQQQILKNSQGVQQHSRQMQPANAGQGGTTGEADWKDEVFDKIQLLKRDYISEIMELDQNIQKNDGAITFNSGDITEQQKHILWLKHLTKQMLRFLQLEKSKIPDEMIGQFARYQNNIQRLVQCKRKLSDQNANMNKAQPVQKNGDQPPITYLTGDASRSLPSPMSGAVPISASPGALVTSQLSSPVAMPGPLSVATACASVKLNDSIKINPTKPLMSTSPLRVEVADSQKKHQMHGGAETPAAKKPIDRLIAALRSASPTVLRSSAQSICSVVCMADCIPHSELQPDQDCMCSKRQRRFNKMKRAFDDTLGSTEGSCMTIECDASDYSFCREHSIKRQKTQVHL